MGMVNQITKITGSWWALFRAARGRCLGPGDQPTGLVTGDPSPECPGPGGRRAFGGIAEMLENCNKMMSFRLKVAPCDISGGAYRVYI